ncbi:MAG: zinc-dependent metalloprotease [Bacteroidia bacterium]|nr:zinc-dependent metalloprotease [Bacteroidia bacterium]
MVPALYIPQSVQAQRELSCTNDAHEARYAADTAYRNRTDAINDWIYREMDRNSDLTQDVTRGLLVVPVVIHIIHAPGESQPGSGSSNPTDQEITQALAYLNDAMRHRNTFTGGPFFSNAGIPGADTEIEFCLAQTDPTGLPTTGITRTASSLTDLYRDDYCTGSTGPKQDECLKSLSFWDSNRYMNIWLVRNICVSQASGNCGIVGYTYMAGAHGFPYDGPVLETSLWRANATSMSPVIHEIGHYLNLFDTYFDPTGPITSCDNDNCLLRGDKICDTPPDAGYGGVVCGTNARMNTCSTDAQDVSANNPLRQDVEDLYENFMDYGAPTCQNSFTPDQKSRMRLTLLGVRSSLLTNSACSIPYLNLAVRSIQDIPATSCSPAVSPVARIQNDGNQPITSLVLSYGTDVNTQQATWSGNLAPGDFLDLSLPPFPTMAGVNDFTVTVVAVNGVTTGDDNLLDNAVTLRFVQADLQAAVTGYPYCVDFEASTPMTGWVLGNLDQQLTFDKYTLSSCDQRGAGVLRYNSAGQWASQGLGAAATGTRDLLISPVIDLSNTSSAELYFDIAYPAGYASEHMQMRVLAISDCLPGPQVIYDRQGAQMQTTPSPASAADTYWAPASCVEWRKEWIDLTGFIGRRVILIFEVTLDTTWTQNLYLDNICVLAANSCQLPAEVPTLPGVYTADQMCRDGAGWVHYWKSAAAAPATDADLMLFSLLNPDRNDTLLQPESVSMIVMPESERRTYDLSRAPYVRNVFGWYGMGRMIKLKPARQPDDSVLVRFYFHDQDIADLNAAIAPAVITDPSQLVMYSISRPEAPLENAQQAVQPANVRQYRIGDAPARNRWTAYQQGGYRYAILSPDSLGIISGGSGKDAQGCGPMYPAPVRLQVAQSFAEIEVSWETEREWQTSHFEVFRSEDGRTYQKVGEVPAAGLAALPTGYLFGDAQPLDKYAYYYVVQHHTMGVTVYSDTAFVQYDPARIVKVYPNPTPGNLAVMVQNEVEVPLQIQILDGNRRSLQVDAWIQEPGVPHLLNIESLVPGIYFYQVIYQGKPYWGKLIKTP